LHAKVKITRRLHENESTCTTEHAIRKGEAGTGGKGVEMMKEITRAEIKHHLCPAAARNERQKSPNVGSHFFASCHNGQLPRYLVNFVWWSLDPEELAGQCISVEKGAFKQTFTRSHRVNHLATAL